MDWSGFLARNDLVWSSLPDSWNNGAFAGNGCLGTICWQGADGALRFEISRTDVYDHRSEGQPGDWMFRTYRMPNGHLELSWGPDRPTGNLRLDLWNAEIRGELAGSAGRLGLRCYVHAVKQVIVIETLAPEGGPAPLWTWHPDPAKSPRTRNVPKDYQAYPPQVAGSEGAISYSVQEMPESAGTFTLGQGVGQYATAWTTVELGQGRRVTYVSMGYSHPGTVAHEEAIATLRAALSERPGQLEAGHRDWWHAFYPASFVSVPDRRLESFYWAQIYKMGSASRAGGPMIDLLGPWYQPTVWPGIWWNLNMQLAYAPFYASNHLAEAGTLLDAVWRQRATLAANAKPYQADSFAIGRATGPGLRSDVGRELGNLPWVVHNLWQQYRMAMDDSMLAERLLRLMSGTFRYLDHLLVPGADGLLHLPESASPEYAEHAKDCSYTAACLRWLATTIIKAEARLAVRDGLAARCRAVLAGLAPYPTGDTGFLIGTNLPLKSSHRHWSHLFMIHPFAEYGLDDKDHSAVVRTSIAHWLSMPKEFTGFSFTAAASIAALDGQGEAALAHLHGLFGFSGVLPNTLSRETGPVIETSLSAARSLQDMLLQSQGDLIRVFPAVPHTWQEVAFADLRAEGAFLVSARRSAGRTEFVRIHSLAGEPCRVRSSLAGTVVASGPRPLLCSDRGDGVVEVDLRRGETALLYVGGPPTDLGLGPVPQDGPEVRWGLIKP